MEEVKETLYSIASNLSDLRSIFEQLDLTLIELNKSKISENLEEFLKLSKNNEYMRTMAIELENRVFDLGDKVDRALGR